jgi:hypothetical protein
MKLLSRLIDWIFQRKENIESDKKDTILITCKFYESSMNTSGYFYRYIRENDGLSGCFKTHLLPVYEEVYNVTWYPGVEKE